MILVDSRVASIDTRVVCSIVESTAWRWAYSCNASRIARASPRVPQGISTYPSCPYLRLTRGGIGVGEFNVRVDGGGSVAAGAGAGGVATGAGDGTATGTDCGMGM